MELRKVMKKNQEIEVKLQIKNEIEVEKISAWLKSISINQSLMVSCKILK